MKQFKVLETIYTKTNPNDEYGITRKERGVFETSEQAITFALKLENEWFEKYKSNSLDRSICALDITIETWENEKLIEIKKTCCPDF